MWTYNKLVKKTFNTQALYSASTVYNCRWSMESCEEFFLISSPPVELQSVSDGVMQFISEHHNNGRPIALIASGGTTVPVERNTVRFLDNFSSGQRGSASAEYFLAHGYAVIFLHRSSSLKPFQRQCSSDNPLDWLSVANGGLEVSSALPQNIKDRLMCVLPQYSEVCVTLGHYNVPRTISYE